MPAALEWRSVNPYVVLKEIHGTGPCYSSGCRCAACKEYSAEKRRVSRARAKGIVIEPTRPDVPATPKWVEDFPIHKYEPAPWLDSAACKGAPTVMFYPDAGRGHSDHYAEARRLCSGCSVADECLSYAIAKKERHGLWGGLTERQRRRVERLELPAALEVGRTIRARYERIEER